jgi:predicted membrane protein
MRKEKSGLLLTAVGGILLLQQMGWFFPGWLTSWPMLLVVTGLTIGTLTLFRNPAWFILVSLGVVFLLDRLYPDAHIFHLVWPLAIIAFGIWIMFGKNLQCLPLSKGRNSAPDGNKAPPDEQSAADGEFLDAVSIFSGVQKNVLTRNLTGGEIVTFMGGVEINLTQADMLAPVTLEVTQVMGGTKLIIPSHWGIVSEMVTVLGGIVDKRVRQPGNSNPDKILRIVGTSVLGGIEIHSY